MMRHLLGLMVCLWLTIPMVAQVLSPCDSINPDDANALYYIGLADAYMVRGQIADAINAYDCSIERDPNFAEAFLSRGVAHASQLNLEQAFADYNSALQLDDTLTAAYINRGVLYSLDINYPLALADFDLVLTLDPNNIQAYHNRAMIYAAEGNYDLAIADLEQALSLDPDYAPSHSALGAVYLALATESYVNAEAINGRPTQFDVKDALNQVLSFVQEANTGVWLGLQEVILGFEGGL